jgi:murein DD-endopeptidase MepM/ murein hydrolase activator NlpD
MNLNRITAAGLVFSVGALWMAAALPAAAASSATADTKASNKKTAAKSSKKKPRIQPARIQAALVTKKKAPKASSAPSKPPADIPLVTGTAAVWRGCLESGDAPHELATLASGLVMEEARLTSLLEGQGLLAEADSECVPYVAATGGEDGVASAIFERNQPRFDESAILAVRKTADGVTVTPGACDCPEADRRVLTLSTREARDAENEVLASVPANVRWQLGILIPRMIGTLNTASAATEPYTVRIVVQRHAGYETEHLHSVEILESGTGKRIDGAWWFEREGGPGVLVGMEGTAYERLLWQSPVKYTQTSRGVGLSITTARRVIAPPKGSKGKPTVKTIKVREYHIGVDMLAPKGMEVHAVGDANVAFAGRMGGYGNLVILDHGLGYQTYYAHLSSIKKGITAGAPVERGDIVGLVGSTGHSTAPHLHFETRKDAKYIDPFDETRQLEFWRLSADDQERLAIELLGSAPVAEHNDKVAKSQPVAGSPTE